MNFRVPSGFIVSVPSGSVTEVPTLMGWPLISVMVSGSPSGSLSFERGSNENSVSSKFSITLSRAIGGSFWSSTTMRTAPSSVLVPSDKV